jgi:PKD repeat protein
MMMTMVFGARTRVAILALAVSAWATGCALDKVEAPGPTGPSEFGLSVTVTASPNQLPRDGSSQAVVIVTVRDAAGQPVTGQRLMLSLPVNVPSGTRLSSSDVLTDANGQATVVVTAPTQGSIGNSILIGVIPVGANLDNVVSRQVSISLTPTNAQRPVPVFSFNPPAPEIGELVQFNASASTDEGLPCVDSCSFFWDFGGEATASGRVVTYRFRAGGSYVVVLTVTDSQGAFETTRQIVNVSANNLPAVAVVASGDFRVGRPVRFAAAATVAPNHRIVSYEWSFGDGSTETTTAPTAQHTYTSNGLYVVRVIARDDLGQTSQGFTEVEITTGLTADFTFEPAIAGEDTTFVASRSVSEGGATIRLYSWTWGDGSPVQSTASPTIDHEFVLPGNYTVMLSIVDSEGRTATRSRVVTVSPAP